MSEFVGEEREDIFWGGWGREWRLLGLVTIIRGIRVAIGGERVRLIKLEPVAPRQLLKKKMAKTRSLTARFE